ncbi:hypothetical protein TNCV_2731291 [Trichonephila clavipes]|nr:hypothetical protein TNCV_2731291 [Trichonephila clavipes]
MGLKKIVMTQSRMIVRLARNTLTVSFSVNSCTSAVRQLICLDPKISGMRRLEEEADMFIKIANFMSSLACYEVY